jgi:CubicO group peptidase (beta-lactamase class C family)
MHRPMTTGLLLAIAAAAVAVGAHGGLPHDLSSVANDALARYSVPGLAVAVLRGGGVVSLQGYGEALVGSHHPVTPDTIFNVGSISKTLAAWGVMRLVEQGRIDLDRPADTYLKQWHLPASTFDNREVTIRRLLSHTSGISTPDYSGSDPVDPAVPTEATLSGAAGAAPVSVVAHPGDAFSYSGANFMILQLVIEDVSGRGFKEFMEAEVFRPMAMSHSVYGLPVVPPAALATPHTVFAAPLAFLRYNALAAAALTTSLRDLAAFAAANMNGPHGEPPGRGVLKPSTVAMMHTSVVQVSTQDLYGLDPGYGLGYTVRPRQFGGHTGVGHGGSNRGWESLLQVVPDTGDGIVLMTNGANGGAVIASMLCAWRQQAGGSTPPGECPLIDVRAALIADYVRGGVDAAVAKYRALRRDAAQKYDFAASQLNSLGYELLRRGDVAGAVHIFELNVEQFPDDWNTHDSLGEACERQGDQPRAREQYRRSLALNPGNEHARSRLASPDTPR